MIPTGIAHISNTCTSPVVEVTDGGVTSRLAPTVEPGGADRWVIRTGRNLLAYRRATFRHRVKLVHDDSDRELPCWTLIVTGRVVRKWGFWCDRPVTETARHVAAAFNVPIRFVLPPRFVPWDEWDTNAGCGEA